MTKKQIILIVLLGVLLPLMADYAGKFISTYRALEDVEWNGIRIQYLTNNFSVEKKENYFQIQGKNNPNLVSIKKLKGNLDIDKLINIHIHNGAILNLKEKIKFKGEEGIKIITTHGTVYDELYYLPKKKLIIHYSGIEPPNELFKLLIEDIELK